MFPTLSDPLLSLFFPQTCQVCQNSVERAADGVACRDCWRRTRLFSGAETACAKCAAYLSDRPAAAPARCHACDAHCYEAARTVGLYEAALAASVLRLKREPHVPRELKRLWLAAFAAAPFPRAGLLIVPVPLAPRRRLERGFNQAEVLGRLLARATGLELDDRSLIRRLDTPVHRAGMDRRARELSVEKAFEVRRPKLIENRAVLLVDDVFTSGATASACAQALKQKGAGEVYVFTLARAA